MGFMPEAKDMLASEYERQGPRVGEVGISGFRTLGPTHTDILWA